MDQTAFTQAVEQGTLTVDATFDYVLNRRDITPSAKDNIKTMVRAVKKNPNYDGDALFLNVQKTEDFVTMFSEQAPGGPKAGRWKTLSSFETYLLKGLNLTDYDGYKHIANRGNVSGLAVGYGFLGTQNRGADPMRGTVSSTELDKIYEDVFKNEIYRDEAGQTYYKGAKGRPVPVTQDTLDYLIYEKYTGQRLDSNIGPDGIKLSDISIIESPDGSVRVEIAEKVSETKTRPQVIYEGAFAQFLKQKYNNKMAALPQGSNLGPDMVDLFGDATPDSVTNLWKAHFKPRLESKFRAQLPASAGGNHKSLRKIISRQLVSEFGYPFDMVKSWMGHAGAGINARGDITIENYTGQVSDPRLGGMVNSLVETEAANLKAPNVNSLFVDKGIPLQSNLIYPTPDNQVVFGRTDTVTAIPMTETAREALEFKNLESIANSKVRLVQLEKQLVEELRNYTPLTTAEHREIFNRQFETAQLKKMFRAEKEAQAAAESAAQFGSLADGAAGMFAAPETDRNLLSRILEGTQDVLKSEAVQVAGGVGKEAFKMFPPVAAYLGGKEYYEQATDQPFPLRILGATAAGASELALPPGASYTDAPFRAEQRASAPIGLRDNVPGMTGLGPRQDVLTETDPLSGRIRPEFATYPAYGPDFDAQGEPINPAFIQSPPPARPSFLEAGGAKERVNLATRAAEQGQETTLTGSFLNPEPR